MLAGEVDGILGMLKINGFKGICGPIPGRAQVEPRASMLKENSHQLAFFDIFFRDLRQSIISRGNTDL